MSDCTECDEQQEYAVAADEDTLPTTGEDPRGTDVTRWGPQLIAPYGKPTGDKRRFAAEALSSRDLPVALKWQRADNQGHTQSVTVGTVDHIEQRDDGVYATGILFDPDPQQLPRLAEDVAEVRHLSGQGVLGPSVDLDDMEFHAIEDEHAGEMAAGDGPAQRPEIEVTRGRISAVTLVTIPAFAEVGPLEFSKQPAEEYAAQRAALTASVNRGVLELPVALEYSSTWDAVSVVNELFESGEQEEYRCAFAWHGEDGRGRRFPLAALVDGTLAVVPGAVEEARMRLSSAALPAVDVAALSTLLDALDGRIAEAALESLEDFGGDGLDDEGEGEFGARFEKLKAKLAAQGVSDPDGLAASIGRHKYGAKGFQKLRSGVPAAKVKPKRGTVTASALDQMINAQLAGDWSKVGEDAMTALVASSGTFVPAAYRAEFFEDPKLSKPTPLTITPEGRVFGHVADWKTCHTGYSNMCVKAPKSYSGYAYFKQSSAPLDNGETIRVGRLTAGGGHADTTYGHRAAAEHYDDIDACGALVNVGEDKHGIWVSGQVRHGADPQRVQGLLESPLSGDWRPIGGQRELIAAHAVNAPGFAITASGEPQVVVGMRTTPGEAVDITSEDQITAIIAAGALARPVAQPASGQATFADIRAIVRETLEEQAVFARKQRAMAALSKIGSTKQDDDDEASETIIPRDARAKRKAAALAALGKGD